MKWARQVVCAVVVLIVLGVVAIEYQRSQVVEYAQYRFNLAWIIPESGVTFVSFDPAEKTILSIPFPANLTIPSRQSGEYLIDSLYKLGSYTGQGGEFARRKIQGFMRLPIPGYLVSEGSLARGLLGIIVGSTQTSLSRLDAILLLYRISRYPMRVVVEDELIRAGVVEDTTYHGDRLQEYVGTRLFDWSIAESGLSVAIVNESGKDGLGSDMADFLTNLGLDVVSVKSGSFGEREKSEWQVEHSDQVHELSYIFESLFGLGKPTIAKVEAEYRAVVLVKVGRDVIDLF